MRVAVDLIRLRSGGETGGAGGLAISVLRCLAVQASDCEFVLLVRASLLDEAVALFGKLPNVRLVPAGSGLDAERDGMLASLGADLLFCPFTAPTLALADPSVPVVSTVVDLQHLRYPKFFTSTDRTARNRDLNDACRRADRIICISEFTRSSLLEHATVSPERVVAIPIGVPSPPEPASVEEADTILNRLGLSQGRFLLYPANFWPHKNHRMLAIAFGLYRNRHPSSDLKLVCTGALAVRMEEFRLFLQRTEVAEWVVLPGYLSDSELATLMRACLALVFPSLYEGFGMPVVEAMQLGKPVLCSDRTSLPEVVGDAALLFDPERSAEIAAAIERIDADPALTKQLTTLGSTRLSTLPSTDEMARAYWHVFQEAVRIRGASIDAVYGVDPDGWTGKRVIVTYGGSTEARYLELELTVPVQTPYEEVQVHLVQTDGSRSAETYALTRDEPQTIVRRLSGEGTVELRIQPVFEPAAHGSGRDRRILGCLCTAARLRGPDNSLDLLATLGNGSPPI